MSVEDQSQVSPTGEPSQGSSDSSSVLWGVMAVAGAGCTIGGAWSAAEAQEILSQGQRVIELALGGVGVSDLTRFCLMACAEASNPKLCLLALPTLALIVGAAGYGEYIQGKRG